MKISKTLIFLGIAILVLVVVAIGYFKLFSGLSPALGPVKDDITELIEETEKFDNKDGVNETEFPLNLPKNTKLGIFADSVDNARFMAFDSDGVLYLSQTKSNKVVALPDRDGDGQADEVIEIVSDIDRPHGLVFAFVESINRDSFSKQADFQMALLPVPDNLPDPEAVEDLESTMLKEYLYIAETGRVIRLEKTGPVSFGAPEVIVSDLPAGGNHFTRTLAISGDKLYVSIGSSCNVCSEPNKHRASIWQYDLDGTNGKKFARGLRNSVGLEFHPTSGKLWATENGRDLIGDDIPPDEINIIEENENYGWPLCYGNNVLDTDFHKDDHVHIRADCTEPFETPSHIDLQAHVAPLGLEFYQGNMFPELSHSLLVALHGSWNRSVPVGYKILNIKLDGETVVSIDDFISGWLQEDKIAGITNYSSLGRPVDVITGSKGEIYISDDKAGVVYVVTRNQ